MRETADRLRQLSKKFYEDNSQKHQAVHLNLCNIENMIDNRDTIPDISPKINNIKECIRKMTELSREQQHTNLRIMKDFRLIDDTSHPNSHEDSSF